MPGRSYQKKIRHPRCPFSPPFPEYLIGGISIMTKLTNSAPTRVLLAGLVAAILSLTTGTASVSAEERRNGQLHLIKECSQYNFQPGGFCTVTASNLDAIAGGTKVYYDQAFGIPAGMLDSNVLLYAGIGNFAAGRCTVEASTGLGVCTFSDGTGQFAGFTARVDVRIDFLTGLTYWDGTYSFNPLPPR
jgi:hypothetical protein